MFIVFKVALKLAFAIVKLLILLLLYYYCISFIDIIIIFAIIINTINASLNAS